MAGPPQSSGATAIHTGKVQQGNSWQGASRVTRLAWASSLLAVCRANSSAGLQLVSAIQVCIQSWCLLTEQAVKWQQFVYSHTVVLATMLQIHSMDSCGEVITTCQSELSQLSSSHTSMHLLARICYQKQCHQRARLRTPLENLLWAVCVRLHLRNCGNDDQRI